MSLGSFENKSKRMVIQVWSSALWSVTRGTGPGYHLPCGRVVNGLLVFSKHGKLASTWHQLSQLNLSLSVAPRDYSWVVAHFIRFVDLSLRRHFPTFPS